MRIGMDVFSFSCDSFTSSVLTFRYTVAQRNRLVHCHGTTTSQSALNVRSHNITQVNSAKWFMQMTSCDLTAPPTFWPRSYRRIMKKKFICHEQ